MAKSALTKEPPANAAGASARSTSSGGDRGWLRNAGVIFVLICVLGIPPVAIGGQMLRLWQLPSALGLPGSQANAVVTYDAPLASPQVAQVAATTASVLQQPGVGAPVATLQGGFPVTITQYASVGDAHTRWAHITWQGAVGANGSSGGQGWTLKSALAISSSSSGFNAAPIGDLGALSIALGRTMASSANHFIGDVYFPNGNARYYTANAQQTFPMGDGLRAILLADLYSVAEGQRQKVDPTLTQGVARGDTQSGVTAYHLLGDAPGVGKYLTNNLVDGVQLASGNWLGAQASAAALIEFYAEFDNLTPHPLLNQTDLTAAKALLVSANASAAAQLVSPSALGGGVIVVSTGHSPGGWWEVASGALAPSNGAAAVVVAVALGEPSAAAAQKLLRTFYQGLTTAIIV